MIEILETSIFTKQVLQLLTEDEYRLLQISLLNHPESGDLIPNSGGLRKKRWSCKGKGKRSGTRTIYYWAQSENQILMLYIYAKNEQDDLTADQVRLLKRIIEKEYP